MPSSENSITELARLLRDIRDETHKLREELVEREKALTRTINQLSKAIAELQESALIDKVVQYCREAWSMSDLSIIVNRYEGTFRKRIQEEVDSRKEEMSRIDEEAKRSLVDLLKVAYEIRERVKKITGDLRGGVKRYGESQVNVVEASQSEHVFGSSEIRGTGIERLFNVVHHAFDLWRMVIGRRKAEILELKNQIINTSRAIREENDRIVSKLNEYSVPNIYQRPITIGVPVVSAMIDGRSSQIYLGRGFEQYRDLISKWAWEQGGEVDEQLLEQTLNALKNRKGPLYKLFLSLKVRSGEIHV